MASIDELLAKQQAELDKQKEAVLFQNQSLDELLGLTTTAFTSASSLLDRRLDNRNREIGRLGDNLVTTVNNQTAGLKRQSDFFDEQMRGLISSLRDFDPNFESFTKGNQFLSQNIKDFNRQSQGNRRMIGQTGSDIAGRTRDFRQNNRSQADYLSFLRDRTNTLSQQRANNQQSVNESINRQAGLLERSRRDDAQRASLLLSNRRQRSSV